MFRSRLCSERPDMARITRSLVSRRGLGRSDAELLDVTQRLVFKGGTSLPRCGTQWADVVQWSGREKGPVRSGAPVLRYFGCIRPRPTNRTDNIDTLPGRISR